MRSIFTIWTLCAGLSFTLACSGSSSQEKAEKPPAEQPASGEETTDAPAPASEEAVEAEETPEEPVREEIDLANADLEELFTVSGSADEGQIKGIIGQRKPDVYKCYQEELPNSPGLTGRVLMQITTTPSGDVASALVKQSTLDNSNVERCMTTKIRDWKFPDSGGALTVITYPFVLPP